MLRRTIAQRLEHGVSFAPARWASRAWHALADPVRPVELPPQACVIGVGGATLGGSGKTPLVAELGRALSAECEVAVVASSYPLRVRSPRRVTPDDRASVVGDEPLALARALHRSDVPVVIGPDRRSALAFGSQLAQLLVVDGLLQTRPRRLALSVLVLDERAPWGSRACPPAGDLRADRRKLLAAADVVVCGASRLVGARTPHGDLVALDRLAELRLGLTLAIARPERVLAELSSHDVHPSIALFAADHAEPRAVRAHVDAWLTTPKCATKLGAELAGAPVWVLEQRVELPQALLERLPPGFTRGRAAHPTAPRRVGR